MQNDTSHGAAGLPNLLASNSSASNVGSSRSPLEGPASNTNLQPARNRIGTAGTVTSSGQPHTLNVHVLDPPTPSVAGSSL